MRRSEGGHSGILPSASGGLSRLAYARAQAAGVDIDGVLKRAGLTRAQIDDPQTRLSVRSQIKFLDLVAEALDDDLLGFRLSQNFELRTIGLLYYVLASSDLLHEAFKRGVRYTSIINEGLKLTMREGKDIAFGFEYVGVPRHADRHQMEFWVAGFIRTCRQLCGRRLTAQRVSFIHKRKPTAELKSFFGCDVEFGAEADRAIFPLAIRDLAVVSADPYLGELLVKYCEEALSQRKPGGSSLGANVENAVALLLPHGKAQAGEVARHLGMSQRTLARRLSSEGSSFAGVLQGLRADLAKRHLADAELSISKIAWLLGYQNVSAFSNAFKRWNGKTPRDARRATQ